ncbi:MAG: AAA-like domain-containing protein [Fibrella sp.]|nr:AAA-like domain-containing protein [Armatimonadota bacterium]
MVTDAPASATPPGEEMTTHPPLTLRLLGPMEVLCYGRPLPALRTHKGLWLIALLTLRQSAPVDRAWLAKTLWADSFAIQAQYNLRRCLSDLRSALGTEAHRIQTPSARTIQFDLSGAEVDIKLMDSAMRTPAPPLSSAARQALENAVALYRGELLEGCKEGWIEADRTRYAETYLGALETLAAMADDANERVAYLRSAITAQPEREHIQRALMQAFAERGDAAAVTKTYRELRVYLRDALNTEPSRETRNLYQTLTDQLAQQSGKMPPLLVPNPVVPNAPSGVGSGPLPVAPEPSSGAIVPGSPYYVERSADRQIAQAIRRGDGLILVKGPRQIGKTSLIAQTVAQLRSENHRVVVTDVQALGAAALHSASAFVSALVRNLRSQAGRGEPLPNTVPLPLTTDSGLLPGEILERFLEHEMLAPGSVGTPLVWVLDEVDGIFACDFRDEIFALFRSWYNARAFDPTGIWRNLTLIISFATEAHLFIADLNQSPFNVGTRFTLADFTPDEVAVLSDRFRTGLSRDDLRRLTTLLGGHPYLNHRALAGIAARETDLFMLEALANQDGETIFSDHLKRMEGRIVRDATLRRAMSALLSGATTPAMDAESFHRLRSAGVLSGETVALAACRCRLYERYLRRRLHDADARPLGTAG